MLAKYRATFTTQAKNKTKHNNQKPNQLVVLAKKI